MLIADLVPQVAIELPGCDDFIVERILREEIANLYRNHALYLHRTTATLATTGAVTFAGLPTQTEVHEVRSMRVGENPIEPVGMFAVQGDLYDATTTYPSYVFMENDAFVVRAKPSAQLTADCVLQIGPLMTATSVADTLAARHRTLWQHIVLARLQAQADQRWTNLKAASVHAGEATRLLFEEQRRADGWTSRRGPVVAYGGI